MAPAMASGRVLAFGVIAIACAMATAFFTFFGAQLEKHHVDFVEASTMPRPLSNLRFTRRRAPRPRRKASCAC